MVMPVSHVENDRFNCILERTITVRQYILKDNPDQRPSEHMLLPAIKAWKEEGSPQDAVFHLGTFYRVTEA